MKSRDQLQTFGISLDGWVNLERWLPISSPDLLDGIPLSQIYSDYMAYLLVHRNFFQERVIDVTTAWTNHFDSVDTIITHPNGWGIHEQVFLRKAAIAAGFPNENPTARIRFVTEAEASVHYYLSRADADSNWLKVCVFLAKVSSFEDAPLRNALRVPGRMISDCGL